MTADQTVRDAEDPDVAALFARLPEAAARDELAARFLPLAEHLARRFGGRGQQHDDLVQVASLGLVHAIDRFDAERGVRFTTFATATIVGELKRYFRDRGWGVRVPRSVQEATMQVNRVMADLWQELGRAPTVADVVARTDLTEESVLEALDASRAYTSASLDEPVEIPAPLPATCSATTTRATRCPRNGSRWRRNSARSPNGSGGSSISGSSKT